MREGEWTYGLVEETDFNNPTSQYILLDLESVFILFRFQVEEGKEHVTHCNKIRYCSSFGKIQIHLTIQSGNSLLHELEVARPSCFYRTYTQAIFILSLVL